MLGRLARVAAIVLVAGGAFGLAGLGLLHATFEDPPPRPNPRGELTTPRTGPVRLVITGDLKGHWAVLEQLNEKARHPELGELIQQQVAIQQRHLKNAMDGSLELAAEEDPNETS